LSIPLGASFAILVQLEKEGFVRVSKDSIQSHRIVAITAKGRRELRR
jgi:DNA-binding PadR family transcriptional regulator